MHHPTDKITHTTAFVTPVVEHWLERERETEIERETQRERETERERETDRERERERSIMYVYMCI